MSSSMGALFGILYGMYFCNANVAGKLGLEMHSEDEPKYKIFSIKNFKRVLIVLGPALVLIVLDYILTLFIQNMFFVIVID